jgi:hypothetical protein
MLAKIPVFVLAIKLARSIFMATVTARKVDNDDYAILGEMAEEHGHSISEELRVLIAEHTRKRRVEKKISDMKALRDRINLTLPSGMTSLELLREERNSW